MLGEGAGMTAARHLCVSGLAHGVEQVIQELPVLGEVEETAAISEHN